MRVYIVVGEYHTYNQEHHWYTEYEDLLKVFVNKQDAKKYIADSDKARCSLDPAHYPSGLDLPDPATDDNGNFYDEFRIEKRKLITRYPSIKGGALE